MAEAPPTGMGKSESKGSFPRNPSNILLDRNDGVRQTLEFEGDGDEDYNPIVDNRPPDILQHSKDSGM